jgi:DNA-binding beta-propeller fold protein YncE
MLKVLKKQLSNKALYIISITACIVCFVILFLYMTNISGYENKSEFGKAELFAKGITSPQGVAFDKEGRLFVQSDWDGKISIIGKDGTVMDYSYVENFYGYGMDIDYLDNFIVASKQQVTVFDNGGNVLRSIKGFDHAYDVAMGPNNILFVSDSAANSIYTISQENEVTLFTKLGDKKSDNIPNAAGICFDSDYKNLYVVNMYSGNLYKISLTKEYKLEKVEVIASNMQRPNFIDMDEMGNVYITCLGDNLIVRINQNSIKEIVDTKGKISNPSGIAISDSSGRELFVGSKDNNSIYKINIGTINQTKK